VTGSTVPTDSQIRALHERYAPSADAFDLVYTHCLIVCQVAEQLLEGHPTLDAELVRAGCLLHDIGVYRLADLSENYIRHGVLGHELLREVGLPEVLCRFCSHHTGVGLSRDDVIDQQLPLPVDDYLAVTGEEQLVMYADKFHSKSTPPVFLTAAAYTSRVRWFGEDKVTRFAAMTARFGEPDLAPLAAHYGHALR
jgi:uncharacterized protein